MPPRLPTITTFGYGIGHFLNDLCSALWFTYSLIFYTSVVNLGTANSGIVMLIGQVADALATPAVGIWSDRFSLPGLHRFGKRKSWYLLGTLMVLVSMPFIYSPPFFNIGENKIIQIVYYAVFVATFQFGWAAVQTVHLALATDLTYVSEERTSLISLRNTFTVVSNIIVYIITFIVLKTSSTGKPLNPDDAFSFQIITASILVFGGLTSLLFFVIVKEEPRVPLISNEDIPTRPNRIRLRDWMKKWALYHVALIYMSTRLYCNVVQSFTPLYLHQSLHLDTYTIALVPLSMFISSFITSMGSGFFIKYGGKKLTYLIGALMACGACVWIELDEGSMYKQYYVYIVAVLLGGASSFVLVVALAITSDLIGADTGNSAFIYGLMSFVDKLSCGIVLMLIQMFVIPTDTEYYTHSLALSSVIPTLLGLIMVLVLPATLISALHFLPEDVIQEQGPQDSSPPSNHPPEDLLGEVNAGYVPERLPQV